MFHQFSDKIQACLLLRVIEDAPNTIKSNHEALKLQQWCREKKAEILKDLNLEKTKEGQIEATYYFRMYSSDACWKEDVNLVQANLDRLESNTASWRL